MKKLLLLSAFAVISLSLPKISIAQITTFPYTQDFEAFAQCGGSCSSTCALQDGWVNGASATRDFSSDTGGTSSSLTGPSTDHNPGTTSGRYLYAESSSPCYSGSNTWHLESPSIDLTGTNDIQFSFWYHMYGQSMGTAHIDVSNNGGATWIQDIIPAWTDDVDLWQEQVVSLGVFTGSTVIVRIRYEDPTNFYGDFAIDDIKIYDLLQDDAGISAFVNPDVPTCAFNDSVSVVLQNFGTDTLTSVNINWTWNAAAQTVFNWTGSLPSGATETVYIGSVNYGVGDDLVAYTSSPNGVTEISSGAGNDTTSLLNLQTGLSGVYTIGATGTYIDFASAIADLNTFGVCGPVTFDVQDGVYTEQLVLGPVIGMDATNTVTFRGESGDPALATLSFPATLSTENYVVAFNEADNYIFEDLTIQNSGATYGRVLDFQGNSDWNTIEGCYLIGTSTTTSTNKCVIYSASGNTNNYCSFIDNTIEGGSYGVYWYGNSTSDRSKGIHFEGNNLVDSYYYGARFYYSDSMTVIDNDINMGDIYTGTQYALYCYYMNGASTIANNDIYIPRVGYGLYFGQTNAAPVDKAMAYNNTVVIEDTTSTSTSYGIYCTNASNMKIMNNSVNVISQGTSSRAAYFTSGGGIEFYNNILSNDGPGYAIYLASAAISASDNNDFYAPNGVTGYFTVNQATLTDWQNATFLDMNSVSGDPGFFSVTDLHTCNDSLLNAAGMVDMAILYDMDGQTRDTNAFDIGADEFLGLSSIVFADDTISKCSQDAVIIGGWEPINDATYLWSTTEITPTINATAAGLYTVTVTTGCGSTSASVEIVNLPDAAADFSSTVTFMTGEFINNSTGTYSSVLWDFGDGTTSTSSNPVHVFPSTGTYTVTLTVTGPCGTDTFTQDVIIEIADIEENDLGSALNVFPNPNNGEFELTVTLDNAANVSAVLVDARGQQVWNAEMGAVSGTASETINVTNNAAGVYFLKVTADDRTSVRKVVIKK